MLLSDVAVGTAQAAGPCGPQHHRPKAVLTLPEAAVPDQQQPEDCLPFKQRPLG